MNWKRYLSIVIFIVFLFLSAAGGILIAQKLVTPLVDVTTTMPDDVIDRAEAKARYNVLLTGTDSEGALTDVIMLIQVDPVREEVNILNIPRDTRIRFKNSVQKINAAHALGKREDRADEYAIRAVKELTGMPVHHYLCVNFQAFRDCIDALGGVEFNVPRRMKYSDPYQDLYIDLQPGLQVLDGDKSEQLVRFRRYTNGDVDRIAMQQQFIAALVDQKLSVRYVGTIPKIYNIVMENIETDLTPEDCIKLGTQVLSIGAEHIKTFTFPGVGQMIGEVSYFVPNMDEAKKLIATEFEYGEGVIPSTGPRPTAPEPTQSETDGDSE